MGKVSKEIATQEIESWLDKKKVFASTRETYKDSIEILTEAIEEGVLTLDENFKLHHKLLFEFGEEIKIDSLTYKPRLNDKMLKPKLNGVKSNDADGRLLAHVAALTDQPRAVLESMDTADKKISMAIAIFFL